MPPRRSRIHSQQKKPTLLQLSQKASSSDDQITFSREEQGGEECDVTLDTMPLVGDECAEEGNVENEETWLEGDDGRRPITHHQDLFKHFSLPSET